MGKIAAMHSHPHSLPAVARLIGPQPAVPRWAGIRHLWLLLILCLLASAALTAVSVQQARLSAIVATGSASQGQAADPAQPARQALQLIEHSRGMEALHLLQASEAGKHALELQLQQNRRTLAALLARGAAQSSDAAAAAVIVGLRADADQYAALQDELLGLSRQALTETAAAARAQQVLAGPSHAVFERMHVGLDRWWTLAEADALRLRSSQQGQQAQAAKLWWALALAGPVLVGLALALCLHGSRAATRPAPRLAVTAALPEAWLQAQTAVDAPDNAPVNATADAPASAPRTLAFSLAVGSWRRESSGELPAPALLP